jgi:diguanylate cyclase (GGDEF)-like protein
VHPHRLPRRITAFMGGTFAVLVTTLVACVLWLCAALDRDAQARSGDLVASATAALLQQIETTTLDYAKWNEAVARVDAGDVEWIYENMGLAAKTSIGAQLSIVRGGPLEAELGWTDDTLEAPRAGILPPGDMAWINRQLEAIPMGAPEAVTHFLPLNGRVYALSTARIEPPGAPDLERPAGQTAQLTMGFLLSDEVMANLAQRTQLSGFRLSPSRPLDGMEQSLPSTYGVPAAYLAWDTPLPGTTLLHRVAAPLALVVLLATGLSLAGIVLARRNAHALVHAEQGSAVVARTDALTGLPNRTAFNEALADVARAGERAILFMDINELKRINDSLGHAAGDAAIVEVARRLRAVGSQEDLVARIGGDEFVVVVRGPGTGARVRDLAHAAEATLASPMDVHGHAMQLGAAIGYAVQEDDGTPAAALVRQADLAMYEAKRHRGQGPVAFGALIDEADRDARLIERALREALERPGELWIAYQPIVDAVSGRLVRAEALARWTSRELGRVPPDRFIGVAERSGLIVPLGWHLLDLVCDDLGRRPDLQVSINVSPLQLTAPAFVPELLAHLARRSVDPSRVQVELTEGVVVDHPRLATQRLAELKEAGFPDRAG